MNLYKYQIEAVEKLRPGNILVSGVGTGKSRTALAFYFLKICAGKLEINGKGIREDMRNPRDLYIITTAQKRDKMEWQREMLPFDLHAQPVKITVDSWNNIKKYVDVQNAFFIFDEQRVVGSGEWVKAFLKISKRNSWILLTATPGDSFMDYVPVFIANGFYKNRTDFNSKHVVFNPYTQWPQVDSYVDVGQLIYLKNKIQVFMIKDNDKIINKNIVDVNHDGDKISQVIKTNWNPYKDKIIENGSEMFAVLRRITNTDPSRIEAVKEIMDRNPKIIIFYNFDYELEMLRELDNYRGFHVFEWNGHNHQDIRGQRGCWLYLVQYAAGAEGWNCLDTNCMIFYSLSYSYKQMTQAAGRIDRSNSPFPELNYYYLQSQSIMDKGIVKSLKQKKDFNEKDYAKTQGLKW